MKRVPVITWNKEPFIAASCTYNTHTLKKSVFATATFKGLWKTCSILRSAWVFFAFLEVRKPNTVVLLDRTEYEYLFYCSIFVVNGCFLNSNQKGFNFLWSNFAICSYLSYKSSKFSSSFFSILILLLSKIFSIVMFHSVVAFKRHQIY